MEFWPPTLAHIWSRLIDNLPHAVPLTLQYGEHTFNKARIMNIAFVEALKQYAFQCFVFHDVDLIPEDDRNMYSCPQQPRHMSVAIDEMGYKYVGLASFVFHFISIYLSIKQELEHKTYSTNDGLPGRF